MKMLIVLSVLFLIVSCNQENTYRINGVFPGVKDGGIVKLMNATSYPNVLLDSATVKNGKFTLTGTFDYPKYCKLLVDMTPEVTNKREKWIWSHYFFAGNTAMELEWHADSLPSFSGSPEQDLYDQFNQSINELRSRKWTLSQEYLKVYHLPAANEIFNTREGMRIVRKINAVDKELNEKTLEFIKNNNTSVVSLYLAGGLLYSTKSGLTLSEIDEIVHGFAPSLQHTDLMKELIKTAEVVRCVAKGVRYHDIELTNLEGKRVKLSEYVKPGEYNMLEFWASWCAPCRGEIPHLRHLYLAGGKKYLNMVSISVDAKDADWKKAVVEEHMEWQQLCDPAAFKGPVGEAYQLKGVPDCLILDPDGKIVAGAVRGAELDVVLKDLGLLGDKIKGL